MKVFTFIGVFVAVLFIVTAITFIVGSLPSDDNVDESSFVFRWLTACIFFAAYVACIMVAKNG